MPKYPSNNDLGKGVPFERKERAVPVKAPSPYSLEQTKRWVEFVKRDYWYRSQMRVTPYNLSIALGTNITEMGEGAVRKISHLIPKILSREIIFLSCKGRKPNGLKVTPFLWILDHPHTIQRLCKVQHWSIKAKCASCGDYKFLPVAMNGETHVACYHCIPPSQYKSIGAQLIERSLINDAGKKIIAAAQGLN